MPALMCRVARIDTYGRPVSLQMAGDLAAPKAALVLRPARRPSLTKRPFVWLRSSASRMQLLLTMKR